jgi:aminopeptidase N
VHEIAHQWWFNLVGNDTQYEPWLDEALANYSAYTFLQENGYLDVAEEMLNNFEDMQRNQPSRAAQPLGLSVYEYEDFSYYTVVYQKGVLFFQALRELMGAEAFFNLLQQYHQNYRFQITTTTDLQNLAEEISGQDLGSLFAEWVYP